MKRTNTFLIEPTDQFCKLAELCSTLWNLVNYKRRQSFFKGKIDWNTDKEYREFAPKIGSATAQQMIRKNNEAWKSFFALLRLKRERRLPPNIEKVRPPGYMKNRRTGKKKLMIRIRNDCYRLKEKVLELPLELKVKWKGKNKWRGKQGALEILFDEVSGRWVAHQPVEVMPQHQPIGNEKLAVDLGVVNLIATNTGVIYSGRSVLSDWRYWTKEIGRIQSELKDVNNRDRSDRLSRTYRKRTRRFRHAVNAMVRQLVRDVWKQGVSVIFLGDLKGIRDNSHFSKRTNQKNHNFWSFRYIIKRIKEVAEEYGMKVLEVNERNTSKTCSICGTKHRNGRKHRGLYYCKKKKVTINADVNGARNILNVAVNSSSRPVARPSVRKWNYQTWELKNPTNFSGGSMSAYPKPTQS